MYFFNEMKNTNNWTSTENGAGAYKSTLNSCLDMFGSFGGMRQSSEQMVVNTFQSAFAEDPDFAVKMLFYFRDIRGGQGTRRQFRIAIKWLATKAPEYVVNNLDNFLEYGRGDDFLCLLDTPVKADVADFLYKQLREDCRAMKEGKPCSLLAKWLPSVNCSSAQTKKYAGMLYRAWGWTPRQYRKVLSHVRGYLKVVEQKMSAKQWTDIKYDEVPSKAAMLYSEAFYRHDENGYADYLLKVANGDAKVNAGALYPYDIVHKIMSNYSSISAKDKVLYDALWKRLPNYCADDLETGICVVDTSGSMTGTPLEVAISLGMYCADKCRGPFAGKFITFSTNPQLQEVKGADITEKVRNMWSADWAGSTNLEKVFQLILDTAWRNNCAPEDMPQKLYIISDMQFDMATTIDAWYTRPCDRRKPEPFMAQMKKRFESAGYHMPTIVYWNVRASQCGMFQQTFDGENCCMVSGYSPSLFKAIIEGTTYEEETMTTVTDDGTVTQEQTLKAVVDPMTVMKTAVNAERYDRVWVKNR